MVQFALLLRDSNYFTLHVPLQPETRLLMNRRKLALMKPTAFVINTARGGLVNEADLVDALRSKRIAGAGIDVFEPEPPANNHALFALHNVLLTPHAAGLDLQSLPDIAFSAARAIQRPRNSECVH